MSRAFRAHLEMLPREHGVYGQLLIPVGTALAIGQLRPVALALASAAVCVFLAHEPLLVLLGMRGRRAARVLFPSARRLLAILAVAAVALGVATLVFVPAPVRLMLIVPATFAVALLVTIAGGREHTIAGEVLSALTLASLAAPVAMAAGAARAAALTCAAVYAVGFVCATITVHAVIMHTRRPPASVMRVAAAGVATSTI